MSLGPDAADEDYRAAEFFRSVFDSLCPGVIVHAADMSVVTCNRRATEILGVSEDSLRGIAEPVRSWTIYDPDGTVCLDHPGPIAMRTGEPQIDRLRRLVYEDGQEQWLLIDAMPMRGDDGELTGVTVSFVDITTRRIADEALALRDRQFRIMAENSGDSVVVIDRDSQYVFVSPSVIRTHGWSPEELVGRPCVELVHADDLDEVVAMRERQLSGGEPEAMEYRLLQPDGSYRWVEGSASPLRDSDGFVTGMQLAVRDISERRAAEDALRRANEEFAQAFTHAPIGMALVALDGRWLRVNPSLCDLIGYSEEQLLTMNFQQITHPDDLDEDLALVEEVLSGGRSSYQMRKRYICADRRVIWILLSVAAIHDDVGRLSHAIAQIQDITELRLMEERLREMADRDHLTGLLNRRRFEEELRRQLDRCARHRERAALLIIDLDGFKNVNDTHGHAAGDSMLRSVSKLITDRVRTIDTVARLGGDEFAVILVDSDREGALQVANSIVEVVRHTDGSGLTVSVGATALDPSDEPDAVLARADHAMYEVKNSGRDGAILS